MNAASHDRGHGSHGRGGNYGGFNNNSRSNTNNNIGGGNSGRGGNNNGRSCQKIRCQVCLKEDHTAGNCWHRFDKEYEPEERHVAAAYAVGTNWYTDSGASDRVTSDLNKLSMTEKYNGADQIHTTNGAGMDISYIGKSVLHTPDRDLILKDVLHVPSSHKKSSIRPSFYY
jgi:hypothetical protein